MANETKRELREARQELARFNRDFDSFVATSKRAGKAAARGFGRNFTATAKFALKEFAKGALQAIGARVVENWGKTGTAAGRKFSRRMKAAAKAEMSTGGGLSRSVGKFNLGALPVIGAAALAATIVSQLSSSLKSAFEQERLQISFNALSADGAGGSRLFEELRSQALRTGVEIGSMANAIQRFLALGFAEEDALQLNRSLLDIAGSLGMSTSEAALLGSALAQVKAKGVASMEELRQQIAEKGVPVFELLAAKIGVTEAEIISMVSAGKIGADTVIEAFQNLEGPLARFRGGADRLGGSAGGLFARLKQQFLDLKRVFGETLLPELKPLLAEAIDMVERMKAGAIAFGERMANALGTVRATFESLSFSEILELAALTFKKSIIDAFDVAIRGAQALMLTLQADTFGDSLEKAAFRFQKAMLDGLSTVFRALATDSPIGEHFRSIGLDLALASSRSATAFRMNEAAKNAPDLNDLFKSQFAKTSRVFGLDSDDESRRSELLDRIMRQRRRNRTGSDPETTAPGEPTPIRPPASSPSAEGLIAGGLANALSRISGGPSTIIMSRQLRVQEATAKNTADTATATQDTVRQLRRLSRAGAPRFT